MSAFKYDIPNGKAEAKLYSMFKFPESNRVHFQCDILVCNGKFSFMIKTFDNYYIKNFLQNSFIFET